MEAFDDRDTISAPLDGAGGGRGGLSRDPIEALRVCGSRHEVEIPKSHKSFTLGAGRNCDLVLEDDYASKIHCALERRPGGHMAILDAGSKNGTLLNGNRVESAELCPGAIITVGKTKVVALGRRSRGRLTAYEMLRGKDPAFREQIDLAIRAASSACSVLIVGETGTGKELVARAIHDASPRCAAPFVALNCGAIAPELIASELFGHERGAFTGATSNREGVFERAHGGTLFLDELAELPVDHQPHLLRVLETGTLCPVGGNYERAVDVRLVAATNRSESLGTPRGPLRPDLYHRVATVFVTLPPLRERSGDIPILVRTFLDELTPEFGPRSVPSSVMRTLSAYPWPGNVRELRHAVQRAVALCRHELTLDKLLPPQLAAAPLCPAPTHKRTLAASEPGIGDEGLGAFDQFQRDLFLRTLEQEGSIRKAADVLDIPKSTFADRCRRLGIRRVNGRRYAVVNRRLDR